MYYKFLRLNNNCIIIDFIVCIRNEQNHMSLLVKKTLCKNNIQLFFFIFELCDDVSKLELLVL